MLTMGLGGGYVTSWVGDPGAVTEYNVRFTAVVPVPNDGKGADIVFSGRIKSADPDTRSVTIALSATTGGKKIFGRAVATARLA
jgi:acyl dehydratase